MYIERNTLDRCSVTLTIASQGEVSPGKGFSLGDYLEKMGLGIFWGWCLKSLFIQQTKAFTKTRSK